MAPKKRGLTSLMANLHWLKREGKVLLAAARDPRTPWYARAVAVGVVAYVVSPIDLIPDFIPVVGWLDDLVIVPLGLKLVQRLIPAEVMAEHRRRGGKTGQIPARISAG